MSALLIRNIDDKLKRGLRLRAAETGRSMEEEVRQILRAALSLPSPEKEHQRTLMEIEATNRSRRGRSVRG